MAELKIDNNSRNVVGGITDDSNQTIQPFRVDPSTYRLLTESLVSGASSIGTGSLTMTASGTVKQLPNVACSRAWVQAVALGDYSSEVVVGDANVSAGTPTASSIQGVLLFPTQGQWFNVNNTNLLYVSSADGTAKVHYLYEV